MEEIEAGDCECRAYMGGAVGIAQGLLQQHSIARMSLNGKGEEPARCEDPSGRSNDGKEVADVDENVGRKDEVIAGAGLGLAREELLQIEHLQPIVEALRSRLSDHP